MIENELSGRELDAEVAKKLLGWKYARIPSDCDGKNECEVLTPDGTLAILGRLQLPLKGALHEAYFVPQYHCRLDEAILLARRFGRAEIRIDGNLRDLPSNICRELIGMVRDKH